MSLNKLLRAFKPKSFANWLPTLKSGPSVVLLLFFEFWCRRPQHGACFFFFFFNRALPVSSGCLPVCISEYFCRRRKGDSHVKYKYTDSEYPQHWSVQVWMKSQERQGTGGRGLTQPLTSLVPLASVLVSRRPALSWERSQGKYRPTSLLGPKEMLESLALGV